jgi:hypothetical protein
VVRLTAPAAPTASCRLKYPQGFLIRLFDALRWSGKFGQRAKLEILL